MGAVRAPGASQRLDRCLRVFRHHSDTAHIARTSALRRARGRTDSRPAPREGQSRGPMEGLYCLFAAWRPPARADPGPAKAGAHGLTLRSEESASRERSAATRARTLKKLIQPCALPPTVTVPHLPSRPTLGIHQRSEFCEKGRLRASRRAAARSRGDRPQTRRSDVHYRQISTTVQDEDVADGRRRSCWMSHATAVCCACALAPLEAMAWPSPGKLTARTSGHLPSCWSAATH